MGVTVGLRVGRFWLGVVGLLAVIGCFGAWTAPAFAAIPDVFDSFAPASVPLNGITSLSIAILNTNGSTMTGVSFTDNLPPGLAVASGLQASLSNSCNGTATAVGGSTSVSLSGGSIAPNGGCSVSVNVIGSWGGVRTNAVTVNSSAGSSSPGTGSLTVLPPPIGARLYWSNPGSGTVSFDNLDRQGGGDLATGSATVASPIGVSLDPAIGRAYWANAAGPGGLSYANLDDSGGGDLTVSGASTSSANGVALDPAAGRIYWAHGSTISYANLDGSNGHDLDTSGATVNGAVGLAIDPSTARIYWANDASNTLSYANLGGGGGVDLTITGVTPAHPSGVALDSAHGRIYWSNRTTNKISYANLDGSNGHDLDAGSATVNSPVGVAIDPIGGQIYWANSFDESVSYASLGGGGGDDLSTAYGAGNVLPTLLYFPGATGAPTVSGGSTPGSVLSCSTGAWAPDQPEAHFYRAPQSFAYQWHLNGSDLGGATSSTLTASATGSYTCSVTASNAVGSAGPQTSAVFSVQPAPPPGVSTAPTGERAAAIKKCKKKAKKQHWTKTRLKKCKKRAKKLPV